LKNSLGGIRDHRLHCEVSPAFVDCSCVASADRLQPVGFLVVDKGYYDVAPQKRAEAWITVLLEVFTVSVDSREG
jgi:hypothetical protein